MSPTEAFHSFASTLVGLPISHVWRGYGSAIFIEIGCLTPRSQRNGAPGNPEGAVSLGVEWSWRIEDQIAILCGSWGEEDLWEPALDALRGARIARCELFGALPEVAITTETGTRFLSFSTTEGQPQWHMVDRREETERWFTVREGQLQVGDGTESAFA